MKEIFAVMRKLISGSGFEEIIFQSGLCSSGSLNGVVSGTHYNKCWTLHCHLAEALERLLCERFLTTHDETPKLLAEKPRFADVKECFEPLTDNPVVQELCGIYSSCESVLAGLLS